MKKTLCFLFFLLFLTLVQNRCTYACSSLLVTKGASKDGSTMITYTADSHTLYGDLRYYPSAQYREGATCDVIEWDTGILKGRIPQMRETYAVIGFMNEHQVAVSETTFTGRKELKDPKGMIDYGNLISLALQRAKTAREAIHVMGDLVARYGYGSTGETLSISDSQEVWMMDIIGQLPLYKRCHHLRQEEGLFQRRRQGLQLYRCICASQFLGAPCLRSTGMAVFQAGCTVGAYPHRAGKSDGR